MNRILIVDDDERLCRMLRRTLEQNGLESISVTTSEAALARVALTKIDAVLLDLVLGTENGWETLRRLRESSDVPVILLTGIEVDSAVRTDAAALGAQDVFQKPFKSEDLVSRLAEILR
jgi:DNA-binding response OmpR family regulator